MSEESVNIDLAEIHSLSIDVAQRTIYFNSERDHDGEEQNIDYLVFTKFIKNFTTLVSINKEPIHIIMSSLGGDLVYSLGIYDIIKNAVSSGIEVHITVIGYMCSGGSLIAQACSHRKITKNSCVLVHQGSGGPVGTFKQINSYVDFYKKQIEVLMEIYVERLKKSKIFKGKEEYEVRNFLNKRLNKVEDWWMSGDEAVLYNLMDKIL